MPQQVLSTPTPSSAIWWIDADKLGGAAHVIVENGGEQFMVDATIDGLSATVTDCTSNLSC